MAAAESIKGRRFAAACGALSSYVKKAAAAAEEARLAAPVTLPLMPGADVSVEEEQDAGPAPASGAAHARMTIFYGGRVVVLDEFPVDRAAELLRLAAEGTAAAQGAGRRGELADDLPMARKASLQRFMEKRKSRLAARGVPYRRPGGDAWRDATISSLLSESDSCA